MWLTTSFQWNGARHCVQSSSSVSSSLSLAFSLKLRTMADATHAPAPELLSRLEKSSTRLLAYPLHMYPLDRANHDTVFKAGVICTSYCGQASGIAVAKAEPGRKMDLYIDYRVGIPLNKVASQLRDPTVLDRDYIIKTVTKFALDNPGARFSVLRLWSSPHFYPLMLGVDNRAMCSFLDDRGRCWEWKFIPKDMPYSEWSMHHQLSLRLQPYEDIWGKQVWVAKDLIIVMGKDEKEARRYSEGATWVVQTKPWRLEVDFWRSFVNVDIKFLEGLDPRWLS